MTDCLNCFYAAGTAVVAVSHTPCTDYVTESLRALLLLFVRYCTAVTMKKEK